MHFKYLIDASKRVVTDRQANPVFFADKPDLLALMLKYATDEEQNKNQQQQINNETKEHFQGNFKKTMTLTEVPLLGVPKHLYN